MQQKTVPGNSLLKRVAWILRVLLLLRFRATRKFTYNAVPMSQLPRIYRMKQMLDNGRVMTRQHYIDAFGTTLSTFKRDLALLRDQIGAPVVWDQKVAGHRAHQPVPHSRGDERSLVSSSYVLPVCSPHVWG